MCALSLPEVSRIRSLILHVFTVLLAGTAMMSLERVIAQVLGRNLKDDLECFDRPYFLVAVLFLGEGICAFISGVTILVRRCRRGACEQCDHSASPVLQEDGSEHDPLNRDTTPLDHDAETKRVISRHRFCGAAFLLALIDVFANLFLINALKFSSGPISQTLLCLLLMAVMVLRRLWLTERARLWEIFGLCCVVVGIVLVEIPGMLSGEYEGKNKVLFGLGIAMGVIAQLLRATMFVYAERVIRMSAVDPLMLLGVKGLFAVLLVVLIVWPVVNVIPGTDMGKVASLPNTLHMLADNVPLGLFLACYGMTSLMFSSASFVLIKTLSAMHCTLIASMNIISVHIVLIILHYLYKETLGESLSIYMLLECTGFAVMTFGGFVFGNVRDVGKTILCMQRPAPKHDLPPPDSEEAPLVEPGSPDNRIIV